MAEYVDQANDELSLVMGGGDRVRYFYIKMVARLFLISQHTIPRSMEVVWKQQQKTTVLFHVEHNYIIVCVLVCVSVCVWQRNGD